VNVPAAIAANTAWISGTVYLVTGQTTLNAGVTLTIEAGAVVKFQNSGSTRGKLTVNGVLLARGTANAPIVFTSIHDDTAGGDTNNNGGATWPKAGDWDGLAFGTTSGGSSLDYATVVYGGADGNIVVTGAAVSLRHGFIGYGSANGLRWLNGAAGEISDTTIQQNLSNGLSLSAASSPAISGNTLRDNRGYAVYLEANCFPAFGGNAVFGNGTNGAGVYGTVGTGTWYANDGLPYVATANLTIESANTLTIQPGTVVKFLPNTNLVVRGALSAVGTGSNAAAVTLSGLTSQSALRGATSEGSRVAERELVLSTAKDASAQTTGQMLRPNNGLSMTGPHPSTTATHDVASALDASAVEVASAAPIVFTSLRDDAFGGDTQGDGAATKPAAGDWGTLYFADTSNDATTVLDYVIVRYAGAGYNYGSGTATAGIALDSASPTLDHLTVELSSAYGLQLLNASSLSLRRSTIQDNGNHGLWLSASSGPAVSGNRFLRNAGYAVYLGGTSQAVFASNMADGNAVNGIGLAGSISSNTTWEPDLPYVIAGNATLEINTALTLQPDVVVKFAAGMKWTINGSLLAEGTAGQPILFTSLKDDTVGGDTNGNANASYPAAGDWESLTFTQTSGGSRLAHVHFRYGGSNSATGSLVFESGAPGTTENLTIMAAKYRGLYANNASPYLSGLRLTGNQVGLYNTASAYAIIQTSAIYSNTLYGVQNANSAYTLMATENWWGSYTGPTHASNPGGIGDPVSNYVDFSGFGAVSPMPLPDPLPPAGTPPAWTTVSGAIASATTWTTAASPYIVTGDVTVNAGVKLTIQPGVIVKFAAGKKLTVNGMLSAVGNAGQRIIFTSLKDDLGGDANGDGTASRPAVGDWGGLVFADSSVDSQTKLQFATVRYAGSGGFGMLMDAASPSVFSDNQISDNSGYGLLLRNYAAPPVSRNWILDNRGAGSSWRPPRPPA
jgi:parallel beta-helix repeat protein